MSQCDYCIIFQCVAMYRLSNILLYTYVIWTCDFSLMLNILQNGKFSCSIFTTKVTVFTHDWHSMHSHTFDTDRGSVNELARFCLTLFLKQSHMVHIKRNGFKRANVQLTFFYYLFSNQFVFFLVFFPFRNGWIFCRRGLWFIQFPKAKCIRQCLFDAASCGRTRHRCRHTVCGLNVFNVQSVLSEEAAASSQRHKPKSSALNHPHSYKIGKFCVCQVYHVVYSLHTQRCSCKWSTAFAYVYVFVDHWLLN